MKEFSAHKIRKQVANGNEDILNRLETEYKTHSEEFSHFSLRSLEYIHVNQSNIGLTICLHDIACHSYRIAKILFSNFVSNELSTKLQIITILTNG